MGQNDTGGKQCDTGLSGTGQAQSQEKQHAAAKSPVRQRTRHRAQAATDIDSSSEEIVVPQRRRLRRKSSNARGLLKRSKNDSVLLGFGSCDDGDTNNSSPSRIPIHRLRRRKRRSPASPLEETQPMPCFEPSTPLPNPGAREARKRFFESKLSPPNLQPRVLAEKTPDSPLVANKDSRVTLEAALPRPVTGEHWQTGSAVTTATQASKVPVAKKIAPGQRFRRKSSQSNSPHSTTKAYLSRHKAVAPVQSQIPEKLHQALTTKTTASPQKSAKVGTSEGLRTAPALEARKPGAVPNQPQPQVEKESVNEGRPVITSATRTLLHAGNTIGKATDNVPSQNQGASQLWTQGRAATLQKVDKKAELVEIVTDARIPRPDYSLEQAKNKTSNTRAKKPTTLKPLDQQGVPKPDEASQSAPVELPEQVVCSKIRSSNPLVSPDRDKSIVDEDAPSSMAYGQRQPGCLAQKNVNGDCNRIVDAELPSMTSCESPAAKASEAKTTTSFDSPFSLQLSTWKEQAVSYLATSNDSEGTTVTTTRCRTEVTWVETKTVCDVTMQDVAGHTTEDGENHTSSKGTFLLATKGTKRSHAEPEASPSEEILVATSSKPAATPMVVVEPRLRSSRLAEIESQNQTRKAQGEDVDVEKEEEDEAIGSQQICNKRHQACRLPSLTTGPQINSPSAQSATSEATVHVASAIDCQVRSVEATRNTAAAGSVVGNRESLAHYGAIQGTIPIALMPSPEHRIPIQTFPEECLSHQAAADATTDVTKMPKKPQLGNQALLPGSNSFPLSIRSDSSSSDEDRSNPRLGPAAHRRRRTTKQTCLSLARLGPQAPLSSKKVVSSTIYKLADTKAFLADRGPAPIHASNHKSIAPKLVKRSEVRLENDATVAVSRRQVRNATRKLSCRKAPPPKESNYAGEHGNTASSLPNVGVHNSIPLRVTLDSRNVSRDSRKILQPETDSSSEDEWQDHDMFTKAHEATCTVGSFCKMWRAVEDDLGELTEDVEEGRLVRDANHHVECSDRQNTAMYGRTTFQATDVLFRALELDPSCDIFLDFGHGIGNAVIQAAFTRRCPARGIEIDDKRFYLSDVYRKAVGEAYNKLWHERDGISFNPAEIDLRLGSLDDTKHTTFLTEGGRMKAFSNNFNGVMGLKAMRPGSLLSIDDNLAGLFGLMSEGSILVTLAKLNFMVPCQNEIAKRRKAANLPDVPLSGFYVEEEVSLGEMKDAVSWAAAHNKGHLKGYRYRRVNEGSYLCWNLKCPHARSGRRVEASRLDQVHNYWVQNVCPCSADSIMSLRCRRKPRVIQSVEGFEAFDGFPSIMAAGDDKKEGKRKHSIDQDHRDRRPNSKLRCGSRIGDGSEQMPDGIEGRPSLATDSAESSDDTSGDEIQWVDDEEDGKDSYANKKI